MSNPDRVHDVYSHSEANHRQLTDQCSDRLAFPGVRAADAHVQGLSTLLIAELNRIVDPSTCALALHLQSPSPVPSDEALAAAIATRPQWHRRDRKSKQTAFEFFAEHYPDCVELKLTLVALRMHDPHLCYALTVRRSRSKCNDVPLLTGTQAEFVNFVARHHAGEQIPIAETERFFRKLARYSKRTKLRV